MTCVLQATEAAAVLVQQPVDCARTTCPAYDASSQILVLRHQVSALMTTFARLSQPYVIRQLALAWNSSQQPCSDWRQSLSAARPRLASSRRAVHQPMPRSTTRTTLTPASAHIEQNAPGQTFRKMFRRHSAHSIANQSMTNDRAYPSDATRGSKYGKKSVL
jgi:hypothetical protein